MDEVKARAEFIGKDGSLGFRNGQMYNIDIYIANGRICIHYASFVRFVVCPYDTMKALLKNWRF